jgi:uncharacterized protein (TIGR02996 family)
VSLAPDEQALLDAVLAAPDDDAPRLVYADWLAERGDARGEYIPLACRFDQVGDYTPAAAELFERTNNLHSKHRRAWIAPLGQHGGTAVFRRGFISELTMRAREWVADHDELARHAPLDTMTLFDVDDGSLRELAKRPWLAALQKMTLLGSPSQVSLVALGASPHVRPGLTLGLQLPLTSEDARALVAAPFAGRIEGIDVPRRVDADTAVALAALPRLRRFTSLTSNLEGEVARALARAPLERVMLVGHGFDDEGCTHLAGIPTLTKLYLYGGLTADGAAAAIARLPPSLRVLDLSKSTIGDVGAQAIAAAPQLAGLVELHLREAELGRAGLHAILTSPHLRSLEYLWIDADPEDAWILEDAANLPSLVMLRFGTGRTDVRPLVRRCPSLRRGRWPGSFYRVHS